MVYFIFFSILFPLASVLNKTTPALEPVGLALLHQSMGVAVKAAFPEYAGGIMLGSSDIPILGTFLWKGVDWTPYIVSQRISIFVFGIAVALLASIFFDRFDPSRSKPRRTKSAASPSKPEAATKSQALSQPILLTPLATSQDGFVFGRVLVSELKLLLKGLRWWWYAGVIGLFIASFANTPENVRAFVLPFTWLWPILIWSGMGNREVTNNTQQMVFSSAAPLLRQLPATWLAGFIVTFLTGSGAAFNFLSAGDMASLLTWFSAALFIPSFALALGVWSNSHKLFEVLYITMWYFALNKLEPVDFLGANSNGNIGFFIPFSVTLIAAAFIGRARQLRN